MERKDYHISLQDTNAIKGLAIIAMLVHHLFYTHPELGAFVQQVGMVGKVCVAMFLFLSGYGLTVQYSKVLSSSQLNRGGQTLRFVYKRFVKFYLSYWVIFMITVPLGVFVFGRGLEEAYMGRANTLLMFVTDFLGLNGTLSYNITWWFNRLIIILYFLFPLLYALIRNKWIALAVMVASYFCPQSFMCFPFILGMWIAKNIDSIEMKLNRINPWLVCVSAAIVTVGLCFWRQLSAVQYMRGIYIDAFITVAVVLTTISLSRSIGRSSKVLPFLGKHSMNIYMVHTFICSYFFPDFIYGFKYPVLIFLVLLLTSLAVSVILEELKKRIGIYKLQEYLIKL